MRRFLTIVILFATSVAMAQVTNESTAADLRFQQVEQKALELETQVGDLEGRLTNLEKQLTEMQEASSLVSKTVQTHQRFRYQSAQAASRIKKDSDVYSKDELKEIERIYLKGESRWLTSDGRSNLKTLTSKYAKSNRTGCALLGMAEMSRGAAKQEYLEKAISDYSDTYYKDGVQVGAYATYQLAEYYKTQGEDKKADRFYDEVLEKYPNAIDHQRGSLSQVIERRR